MRRSPILVLLSLCACSGEAAFTAPTDGDPRGAAGETASSPLADPGAPSPLEVTGTLGPASLQLDGGVPVIHGIATLAELVPQDAAVFIGLDWVIEEGLYPLNRTTGRAALGAGDPGEFALRAGEPLAQALVANEATNRAGVAVAYLTAFVDADGDGILGCPDSECADYRVGGSRNAMVVYAEEAWPADGAALFAFNGAAGVRPPRGWSLISMAHQGPRARPIARDWTDADTAEVVIIGDYRELDRNAVRSVQLDID